jgi:hypothetical protein
MGPPVGREWPLGDLPFGLYPQPSHTRHRLGEQLPQPLPVDRKKHAVGDVVKVLCDVEGGSHSPGAQTGFPRYAKAPTPGEGGAEAE